MPSKISPNRYLDPILIELGLILWWCRSIRGIKLNVLECTTGSTCSDPMPRRASKYHQVRVKYPHVRFPTFKGVPGKNVIGTIWIIFYLIRSHKVKYGSNKVILNISIFSWDSQISRKSDLLIDLQDWWEFISHEYFINSEIQINLTSARLGRNHVIGCHVMSSHMTWFVRNPRLRCSIWKCSILIILKIKRGYAFKFNA